jgi:transcription elongation factor Elf1
MIVKKIQKIKLKDEFRKCPSCNYEYGFHVSFLKNNDNKYEIILICPNCGARYNIEWNK